MRQIRVRRWTGIGALLLVLAVISAACGGGRRLVGQHGWWNDHDDRQQRRRLRRRRRERCLRAPARAPRAGCDPGPLDGKLGADTVAAIKRFQTAADLVPDGIVGPDTGDPDDRAIRPSSPSVRRRRRLRLRPHRPPRPRHRPASTDDPGDSGGTPVCTDAAFRPRPIASLGPGEQLFKLSRRLQPAQRPRPARPWTSGRTSRTTTRSRCCSAGTAAHAQVVDRVLAATRSGAAVDLPAGLRDELAGRAHAPARVRRWTRIGAAVLVLAVVAVACGGDDNSSPSVSSGGKTTSDGNDVLEIQRQLNGLGCDVGPLDGTLGPDTEAGIRQFQSVASLVVDGIVVSNSARARCRIAVREPGGARTRRRHHRDGATDQPVAADDPSSPTTGHSGTPPVHRGHDPTGGRRRPDRRGAAVQAQPGQLRHHLGGHQPRRREHQQDAVDITAAAPLERSKWQVVDRGVYCDNGDVPKGPLPERLRVELGGRVGRQSIGPYPGPMRVLVVEDEARMAALLERGLREEGYAVDVAADGPNGLWMATENDYDAVLLDIMLPGFDGFDVCRRMREAGALGAGPAADGTRRGREPRAGARRGRRRLRHEAVQLRRARGTGASTDPPRGGTRPAELEVGDLRLNPPPTVHHAATWISRVPEEMAVLELLMRNAGAVVTRTQILEHAWDCCVRGRVERRGSVHRVSPQEGRSAVQPQRHRDGARRRLPAPHRFDGLTHCRSASGSRSASAAITLLLFGIAGFLFVNSFHDGAGRLARSGALAAGSIAAARPAGAGALAREYRERPDQRGGRGDPRPARPGGADDEGGRPSPGDRRRRGSPRSEAGGSSPRRLWARGRARTVPHPGDSCPRAPGARGATVDRIVVVGTTLEETTSPSARSAGVPLRRIDRGGARGHRRLVPGRRRSPTRRADAPPGRRHLGPRHRRARLNVPRSRDEIARLARTMNRMLGRLQGALGRQRNFVADAGHELEPRSRCSRPSWSSQGARGAPRTSSARDHPRRTRDGAAGLAGRRLAVPRPERRGRGHPHRCPAPARARSDRALDRCLPRTRRPRRCRHPGERRPRTRRAARHRADPARPRQLGDDALRYAPVGSAITVAAVSIERPSIGITVSDRGPGFRDVPASPFERFGRASDARGSEGRRWYPAAARDRAGVAGHTAAPPWQPTGKTAGHRSH